MINLANISEAIALLKLMPDNSEKPSTDKMSHQTAHTTKPRPRRIIDAMGLKATMNDGRT